MGGLVSQLQDHLVLGVRKLLVEACYVLNSCGLKSNLDDVGILTRCENEELAIR
jgi:hypothetical protein